MEIQKALEHFRNKHGQNYNCAQSVAAAFDADPAAFAKHGGGKAPEGWCGAAYVAAQLGGDAQVVEAAFRAQAGTPKCREILRAGAFKCAGCVELGVRLIQEHLASVK